MYGQGQVNKSGEGENRTGRGTWEGGRQEKEARDGRGRREGMEARRRVRDGREGQKGNEEGRGLRIRLCGSLYVLNSHMTCLIFCLLEAFPRHYTFVKGPSLSKSCIF